MLRTEALAKSYKSVAAVRNVSFDVARGEIFGLLGQNGAGKTTTIEMLCGLIKPDGGAITIDEIDVVRSPQQAQRKLGYAPQQLALWPPLTARENLQLVARLRHLTPAMRQKQLDAVINALQLAPFVDRPTGVLSGGEQRRVLLAMSLVHAPPLLILDEPTAGVDVVSRRAIQSLLKEVRGRGTAVVYTSHYLEEAEALCDRVAIIHEGELIVTGAVEQLMRDHGAGLLDIRTAQPIGSPTLSWLRQLPHVRSVTSSGETLLVSTNVPQQVLRETLRALSEASVDIVDVSIAPPSLEAAFIHKTGERFAPKERA